jgi:hypothetical protein
MSIPTYEHDPNARLDYLNNWSAWLPAGDTIVTSTWVTSDPAIIDEDESNTTTTATVWIRTSGAALENEYLVVNHITTAQGRQEDQTIKLKIRQR